MALIQTHRFNWMGYEGTESETLNIALLRPSTMSNLRNDDCKQRRQIVEDIRLRLKFIKCSLGLLPTGPNGEGGKCTAVGDDAFLGFDAESTAHGTEAEMAAQLAERRRKLLAKYGPVGDSDEDEEELVCLYPKPPSPADVGAAMKGVSLGVKALLLGVGESFVSYLDGAEYVALAELEAHNAAKRDALETAGAVIPAASEFDTTVVAAAVERRNELRARLDAVRAARDPTYAAKHIPATELNARGQPVAIVTPGEDEASIMAELQQAKAQLDAVRLAYNARAVDSVRRVQQAIIDAMEEREL